MSRKRSTAVVTISDDENSVLTRNGSVGRGRKRTRKCRVELTPSSDSENDENAPDTSPKYTYDKLFDVRMNRNIKYANVYGVLLKEDAFAKRVIHLQDESCVDFSVILSETDTEYPIMKTGDVIRIHRLICDFKNTQWLCFHPRNLLVISSFSEKQKIRKSSLKYTFESFDMNRTKELHSWFSNELIEQSLCDFPVNGYGNIVCQIVDIHIHGNSATFCIFDGTTPRSNFRDERKLNFFAERQTDACLISKCALLTVYDIHIVKAQKLLSDIGSYIVVFNVKSESQKGLNLHGNQKFGKCIRRVHKESELGELLKKKIYENDEDVIHYEEYNEQFTMNASSPDYDSDSN
ncbi:Protection of telomeres protein 1-like protein, partial [Leptotrombidium deliense]